MRTAKVSFRDLTLDDANPTPAPFFTSARTTAIIQAAPEPYKTMFAVASGTGCRAEELFALKVSDLDFDRKTVSISRSADDNTRLIRETKTKKSTAVLLMPSALEARLRHYLANYWKLNAPGLLFPNRKGTRPRSHDNVVKYGLHRALKSLGLPTKDVGLHAFRHGLATELADASVPLPALKQQMRHADVRTNHVANLFPCHLQDA